ncbi:hypothetical protein [Ornithinimicrobium sp. W1665]|uniref:hypothetical protein n=1 Tax=Ornithinimicrobium sp. W1665 TaxID=3416666 RepID=UPI003D6C1FC8
MRTTAPTVLVLGSLLLAGCVSSSPGPAGSPDVSGEAPTAVDVATPTTTAPEPADVAGPTTQAPVPTEEPDAAADLPRLVGAEDADLVLHVSNQVPTEEVVGITVAVDGEQLIDQDFAFEEGHNWIEFGLELPPGEHPDGDDRDGSGDGTDLRAPGGGPTLGRAQLLVGADRRVRVDDEALLHVRGHRGVPALGVGPAGTGGEPARS